NDGLPPKIGIGGHLAAPPLPHHRGQDRCRGTPRGAAPPTPPGPGPVSSGEPAIGVPAGVSRVAASRAQVFPLTKSGEGWLLLRPRLVGSPRPPVASRGLRLMPNEDYSSDE